MCVKHTQTHARICIRVHSTMYNLHQDWKLRVGAYDVSVTLHLVTSSDENIVGKDGRLFRQAAALRHATYYFQYTKQKRFPMVYLLMNTNA